MKKLLFVLVFAFIGQQAFSQIYLVTIVNDSSINSCYNVLYPEATLTKVTPTGVETHICIPSTVNNGALTALNAELNSITSQGYKLIETNHTQYSSSNGSGGGGSLIRHNGFLNCGTTFIFAIVWIPKNMDL